jgi:hypothetical protein
MTTDTLVYDLDGRNYVANFDGQWLRWPAEVNGWALRVTCGDPGDQAYEYPPAQARLALMLSGVDDAP